MPDFVKPQLATLKMKAPSGAQWIHIIKEADETAGEIEDKAAWTPRSSPTRRL
jgi:hypothetical protein